MNIGIVTMEGERILDMNEQALKWFNSAYELKAISFARHFEDDQRDIKIWEVTNEMADKMMISEYVEYLSCKID